MLESIEKSFREIAPAVEFCSLRFVHETSEQLSVRRDVLQPVRSSEDLGAMLTVCEAGGMGYAATSDLSTSGLRLALEEAREWARHTAARPAADFAALARGPVQGDYETPVARAWDSISLRDKLDLLRRECARLGGDARIVERLASLFHVDEETLYLSSDGARLRQRFRYIVPVLSVTANRGSETETRTFGRHALGRQGGLEVLDAVGFHEAAPRMVEEVLELLAAPNCPTGTMHALIAPDQMILQIHESIGHPLELDRILGDERNFAGASFVTLDMFGSYRYGSSLLNVVFDPTRPEQLASYAFDDEGEPARREYLIKGGILLRPLGGRLSQARAGIAGVANARACAWNRPPIDRMANLNLEPGSSSFEELLGSVERGIYLETNCSWSIDDSRNKFQFGCERGRLIQDGELGPVVRKPNYRGLCATFWRSLEGVGSEETLWVMGTPNCGKGEPNQAIRVGHASPVCLFAGVDVFGGA